MCVCVCLGAGGELAGDAGDGAEDGSTPGAERAALRGQNQGRVEHTEAHQTELNNDTIIFCL